MLVSPGAGPVSLGWVAAGDLSTWDSATTTPLAIKRAGNSLEVSAPFVPPSNPANLRMDFSLSASAGGKTAVVLAFRQLFQTDDKGLVTATRCAIDTVTLTATSTTVSLSRGARRRFTGQHPLVTIAPLKISVNAEFVDLTELWWAIRSDKVGWYLNSALGGRPTHLRVLGWTTNGYPMIWFACIPDAAELSITGAAPPTKPGAPPIPAPGGGDADLVFLRPQAGINTFGHSTDAKGLADTQHDHTTMWLLARYLLSPIPSSSFAGIKSAGTVPTVTITMSSKQSITLAVDQLADRIQPSGSPAPADPMDQGRGLPDAFRPVGMEAAFNRAGRSRVMLVPVGVDTNSAYEGVGMSGLRTTVRSALGVLWSGDAVDRRGTGIPDLSNRELWAGAHSGANLSMFECVRRNAADIARIITFDAAPRARLMSGISTFLVVNNARKAAGKKLEIFAIVSPNLTQDGAPGLSSPFQGLDDAVDLALRRTGAVITELPDYPERVSFWTPSPAATPKTFVQYVVSNWSDAQVTASAANPGKWRFLFFHELAVYGGHLVPPPSSAPAGTSPSFRTFFEDALGAPNPRPAPP
jgi:hypothetical protein